MGRDFIEPLDLDLGENGGRLTATNTDELREWIDRQEGFWLDALGEAPPHSPFKDLRDGLDHFDRGSDHHEQGIKNQIAEDYVRQEPLARFPHSESARGRFITELSKDPEFLTFGALTAFNLLRVRTGNNTDPWRSRAKFLGQVRAALFSFGVDSTSPDRVRNQLEALQAEWAKELETQRAVAKESKQEAERLRGLMDELLTNSKIDMTTRAREIADERNGFNSQIEEQKQAASVLAEEATQAFHDRVGEVTAELENFEEVFKKQLQQEVSVKHWEVKEGQAKKESYVWGYGALVFALILVAAAWIFLSFVASIGARGLELLPYYAIAGVGVAGLAMLLRLFTRLMLSAMHTRADATERIVMLKTYLSLLHEKALDEKQKAVMFSVIFRPSTFGLIKAEENKSGNPYFDLLGTIIEGAFKSKRDG